MMLQGEAASKEVEHKEVEEGSGQEEIEVGSNRDHLPTLFPMPLSFINRKAALL